MRNPWVATVALSSIVVTGCGQDLTPDQARALNLPAPATALTQPAQPAAPNQAAPTPAPSTEAPREAPAAASSAPREAPPAPAFREVSAPAGTELRLELSAGLSTETAQVETPVTARLRRPVVVDGITVFPEGALFYGSVTEVERPGRVRGRAHLVFRLTEVVVHEARERISTSRLVFEGEATKSEDATKVGGGAGLGALIGGVVGGGSGAAKGAAIGAAAGAGAVLATRGRDVELPAGSAVTATLASPFTIRVTAP